MDVHSAYLEINNQEAGTVAYPSDAITLEAEVGRLPCPKTAWTTFIVPNPNPNPEQPMRTARDHSNPVSNNPQTQTVTYNDWLDYCKNERLVKYLKTVS